MSNKSALATPEEITRSHEAIHQEVLLDCGP